MKRLLILVALLLALPIMAQENTVNLVWDRVLGAEGYDIYFGTQSRVYGAPTEILEIDCGEDVGLCTMNLTVGQGDIDVFVSIKAKNTAGQSIGYSREIVGYPNPEVNSVPTTCVPKVGGGVNCTAQIAGYNFAPEVAVSITYPGVTVSGFNRLDPRSISLNFEIAASAGGGAAPLVIRNPWIITEGTGLPGETAPMSGMAGATFPDAIIITPVVLPSAPLNIHYVDKQ